MSEGLSHIVTMAECLVHDADNECGLAFRVSLPIAAMLHGQTLYSRLRSCTSSSNSRGLRRISRAIFLPCGRLISPHTFLFAGIGTRHQCNGFTDLAQIHGLVRQACWNIEEVALLVDTRL